MSFEKTKDLLAKLVAIIDHAWILVDLLIFREVLWYLMSQIRAVIERVNIIKKSELYQMYQI